MPINTVVPTQMYTITSVGLPDECYRNLPEDEPGWGKHEFQPCSNFKFSPDEHYLGFLFGPDLCGRGIIILNTRTEEIIYRSGVGNGLGFEFLNNGKVLISTGHCEGGQMSLLDPTTKEIHRLGDLGRGGWNVTRTAIAVETGPYQGVAGAIWGYNAERDFLFLPQPEDWQRLDDHLLWSPDGSHILYLHRPVSYTFTSNTYTFPEPSQIIRVNTDTGEKQVLVSDPRYNHYFCAGAFDWCDQWYGDWIQVRRFPFEAQSLAFTDDFYRKPVTTCLLHGIDCTDAPELFALNWRSGELVPWDELWLLTAPTPTQ
jgi:hypothetical protein